MQGRDIALLAVGSMVKVALTVREKLKEKGLSCSLTNARFVKPIDEEMIREANRRILAQSDDSVLAQANQTSDAVTKLLD